VPAERNVEFEVSVLAALGELLARQDSAHQTRDGYYFTAVGVKSVHEMRVAYVVATNRFGVSIAVWHDLALALKDGESGQDVVFDLSWQGMEAAQTVLPRDLRELGLTPDADGIVWPRVDR
jgi:hypothetical protein